MPNIATYNPRLKLKSIRVAYLDNQQEHLDEFLASFPKEMFSFLKVSINPDEIIELACNRKIDVLISDYKMPNKNGIELLKYCKKENPELKLILYTGFALTQELIKECEDNNIYKIAKVEPQNLINTISLVANEIENFSNDYFSNINIVSQEQATITPTESYSIPTPLFDKLGLSPKKSATQEELLATIKRLSKKLVDDFKKYPEDKKLTTRIHITPNDKVSVKELIDDLENVSPRGLEYIELWLEAKAFIKSEIEKEGL